PAVPTAPKYHDWTTLLVVGAIAGFALLLLAIGAAFVLLGMPFLLVLPVGIGLLYGCVLYAYFHYRQGRQDEFLHLLTTAVESGAPLSPVLRAYLDDRPRGPWREAWVALLLFPLLPGYYWLWYRERCYDQKVEAVVFLLEQGAPLSSALRAVPGVAARESVWGAALGEATGKLALCLRGSAQAKLATLWLEMLPRLLYPLLLWLVMLGITSFWMVYVLPRMQRI